ncbi:hypothetical protein BGX38DRAFT_270682 [Terfezia claveryi]|nr:hypothetical protein BGX38DRAFT_270682 [Terfezia claveryi]
MAPQYLYTTYLPTSALTSSINAPRCPPHTHTLHASPQSANSITQANPPPTLLS